MSGLVEVRASFFVIKTKIVQDSRMISQRKIDRNRLAAVWEKEKVIFTERTVKSACIGKRASNSLPNGVPMTWMAGLYRWQPIYITHGKGESFYDVDGNRYIDFNLCDLSMTAGYGNESIALAVSNAVKKGAHFLLPTQEVVDVSEELAHRVGLPHWQFTLSASGANVEVLRIARAMTKREKLVLFEGHYNGHFDEALVMRRGDGGTQCDLMGTSKSSSTNSIVLPFNDLATLELTLSKRETALIIAEPMMTNCNLVKPDHGFWSAVERMAKRYGTLVCYDEAHSFQFAFGGLVRTWNLNGDFVVLGKGLGTGVSFGLYGMADHVAHFFKRHSDIDVGPKGIATGGTTYGSNIAVSAAKSALFEVLTPAGYERIQALGARLSDGLRAAFAERGLPWCVMHYGPRVGYCLKDTLPRTGPQAWESIDVEFIDTRRLFMANRGLWDAVASAGPQVSFAHSQTHIDLYVSQASSFLDLVMDV